MAVRVSGALDAAAAPFATCAMTITVCAFYKFVAIDDAVKLRSQLLDVCQQHGILGTILLAAEGINATVSGRDSAIAALLNMLHEDCRFVDLECKHSTSDAHPFQRLKVKIKREIVSFNGKGNALLAASGRYVAPEAWNALVQDPNVVVIDTRNVYEVAIGTFPGAIDPKTRAFSEFPEFAKHALDPNRHLKVAMFCTGGIRCEKASAHLLELGFREVYHLQGGILKYLETVPPEVSLWQGECFVFDDRVALEHGVRPGLSTRCLACGNPIRQEAQHEAADTPQLCANCRAP